MPQTTKTFRVFVSSTFTDMRAERHILQTDVSPRLKSLCESKGASFQDVDLRWGVNEEAQLDQKIMDICLGEIARCQKLSPRPNFIILLGDKYGWQPIPSRIPSDEMDLIRSALDGKKFAFVDRWYREDLNAAPHEYVLQPRGDEYQKIENWREAESGLRKILRSSVNKLSFTEEQRRKYFASATHQEIIAGALTPPDEVLDPEEHVFAYLRTIRGLPEDRTAADYIDLSGDRRDTKAKTQLNKLKKELRTKLPRKHVYPYDATWSAGCALDDAKAFGDRVYADLKRVIEEELQDNAVVDPLTREKSLHEEFKEQRRKHFTGRKEALQAIADYLDGLSQLVFTVIGASGSGKTSLLAQALHEATGREGVTIFRFLGTTSTASDVSRLLADLINDICTEYQVDKNSLLLEGEDETKFSTLMGLQELLPRCLNLAGKEKPLLIVLDALDQLSRDFTTLSLDWIPKELPNHAKLIVSALPDLRDKLSQTVIHDLTAMPAPEGEELLTAWLNAVHRTLTPEQTRLVFDRFTPVGTPLYLKLAFENARKWHSYDTAQSLKADIAGVLDEFFAGLERVHGRTLLKTLCCYLLSGKYQGLMEQEILDLLVADEEYWLHFLDKCHLDHRQEVAELKRLPIVVWSRLFLDLEPYLTTRNADGLPIISFYHRKFSEYVKKEYLTDPLPWHVRIADHFDKAPLYLDDKEARPNVRKVVEQPWQQTLAQQWGEIVDKTLASFPFLMAKAKADMVEGILEDYAFLWGVATENTKLQLDLWRAFFAERTHILRRGNEELPAFKILLQLAVEHADDSLVTKGAEEWLKEERCNWLWLRRVQRLPHTHKGPCVAVLEGHTEGVRSALELTDGRLLSWSALDHTLRLWDGQTGACLMVLKGHSSWVWGALELLDGRILSWSDDGSLRLWDRQSGACIKMLIGHQGLVRGALELNDGRLLSWSDDGSSRLWDDQTGACLEILKHTNAIFCGLVLADDRILLRSKDKTLLLWYVQKSYCIALKGHSDLVNGTLIFSEWQIISWSDDKTLRLWDANNFGLCVKVFEGHTRSVKGALKLGEGQILSWSDDKTLRIWDVQSGKCLAIFEGHTDSVKGALKLGEGQILSWSDDNTLRIWDIQSGKCLAIFEGHTDSVKGAIKLGEGRILSWSFDRTLRLWDYEKCKVLAVLKGHSISVEGALELTDGRLLSWSMDKTLRLWDTKSDSNITVPKGHADSVEGALELADGRIISWSRDNDLLLWNCQSGTCLGVLTGHTNSVNGAMELANGRILSWSDDGSLRLWNTQNGECLAVQPGYAELILALSNGLLLSWTSRIQYALQLWDGESIAHKISLIGHKRPVNGALELKDGRILSWSQDSSMRLWDGQSGECLMGPIWSGTVIGALELADGRLLTWSEGATLQLWDGQSGASLAVLNGCTNPIEGALELTEGRILSWEWPVSTVRLWDSQNGNCLEVVAKDQIAKRYPEWIYDMQQSQNYRCISGDLFVGSTARVAYLRQKTTPSILTGWHAESDLVARCLLPDGTVVATEANGQVCFLKLHHGQRRVPLAEAEMLLPTLRKHAT